MNSSQLLLVDIVFTCPITTNKCLLLVKDTLVRLSSLRKPIDPPGLALTVDTIIMSFSCPWNESTVFTIIFEFCNNMSIFLFCD